MYKSIQSFSSKNSRAFSVNSKSADLSKSTNVVSSDSTSPFKTGKTLSTSSCFLPETFKPFSLKISFNCETVYFFDISSGVNASPPVTSLPPISPTSPLRYPSSTKYLIQASADSKVPN